MIGRHLAHALVSHWSAGCRGCVVLKQPALYCANRKHKIACISRPGEAKDLPSNMSSLIDLMASSSLLLTVTPRLNCSSPFALTLVLLLLHLGASSIGLHSFLSVFSSFFLSSSVSPTILISSYPPVWCIWPGSSSPSFPPLSHPLLLLLHCSSAVKLYAFPSLLPPSSC